MSGSGQRQGMSPAAFGEHQRNRIVEFIQAYVKQYQTAPSVAEIGAGVGIAEDNARKHIQKLIAEGRLEKGPGYRSLRVVRRDSDSL